MCTFQRLTSYFLSSSGILPIVSVCTSCNRSTALLRKGLYVLPRKGSAGIFHGCDEEPNSARRKYSSVGAREMAGMSDSVHRRAGHAGRPKTTKDVYLPSASRVLFKVEAPYFITCTSHNDISVLPMTMKPYFLMCF
jgi:hypothetical protein